MPLERITGENISGLYIWEVREVFVNLSPQTRYYGSSKETVCMIEFRERKDAITYYLQRFPETHAIWLHNHNGQNHVSYPQQVMPNNIADLVNKELGK